MPGILDKFSKKIGSSEEDTEIEEYLDTLGLEEEDLLEEEADMWIRPMTLEESPDTKKVNDRVKDGNIVLLNIKPLFERNTMKLKKAVSKIKGNAKGIDGDIARLSEYKLLIAPQGVKIAK